ncbi:MAG: adenylate/guanylate cyclase domain-containing protein [Acidimicrobiales bacterium]
MKPESRAEVLARLRGFLLDTGASEAEIDRAEDGDVLDLLVADRLLVPADRRYTEEEVSSRTGMPTELARKFWRALGFPDVAADERFFTDLDVEAILTIQGMMALGVAEVDTALHLARVIGSSMARIAEAEVSPAVTGGPIGPFGPGDSVEAADRFARLADQTLPAMARLLEFAWRRHVQAATRRAMLLRSRGAGAKSTLCVGFADMVGFTMLSRQLSEEELATVVSRFEEVAHFTVIGGGGRVVKMIGDEAMFVTESAAEAASISLSLADAYADDELLSDVRVGLSVGPVLIQDGDFYGPVVNLAHRIVNIASPGSVLLSDEFHDALIGELGKAGPAAGDDCGEGAGDLDDGAVFAFRALRPRQIKDVGRVQLWALHRAGTEPVTLDRRIGRRLERFAEVLHDLDDLRDRGERLLAGGLRSAWEEGAAAQAASAGGQPHRGDAEGAQPEGPVDRFQGAPPEIDEPA